MPKYCPTCGDRANVSFEEQGTTFYSCTNNHTHREMDLEDSS